MWVFLIFDWGTEKGCRIVRIVTGWIFWWLKKWWVFGKSCIFAGEFVRMMGVGRFNIIMCRRIINNV